MAAGTRRLLCVLAEIVERDGHARHTTRWSLAGRRTAQDFWLTMSRGLESYDLSGRSSLAFDARDARLAEFLAKRMDPFVPNSRDAAAAGVVVEQVAAPVLPFADIQNAARDGMVTASDGDQFFVVADGRACAVPDPLADRPIRFAYEPAFPLGRIFAPLVRPALHLSLHASDAVAVHSATAEMQGRAVLVAGWSESGKTETALALMEMGGRFLSDKWTILGTDGEASAFPINVGVRRWVLPYLPKLQASLPVTARAQLGLAGAAAAMSRPLRERPQPGRVTGLAERALALADRAALTPSQLRAAYGDGEDPARRVPLGATAILTTVPGREVTCEPADPAWAAARLARSAAYERRELFAVLDRRRFAFPDEWNSALEEVVTSEALLLERALAQGSTFELRAPFPCDPRKVAAALVRRL
jgi:hypothetical protein